MPDAVGDVLAQLLKLRLFVMQQRKFPEIPVRVSEKKPAHQVSAQRCIGLMGAGNTLAEVRWNFSDRKLLPEYLWDFRRDESLKPKMSDVTFAVPARIQRACNALPDFHLMQHFREKERSPVRIMRVQRRIDVPAQLDATELTLVIKVQFSWSQAGTTFPDEAGPREFFLGDDRQGFALTLEESVDAVVARALGISEGRKLPVYHPAFDRHPVGHAENPCDQHYHNLRGDGARPKALLHNSRLRAVPLMYTDHIWPFKDEEGRYLMPAGEYYLELMLPPDPKSSYSARKSVAVDVLVQHGDDVLLQERAGGNHWPDDYHPRPLQHLSPVLRIERKKRSTSQEPNSFDVGDTLKTRITDVGGETEERTYLFVSVNQYNEAWEKFYAPFVDEYKMRLCAKIEGTLAEYGVPGYVRATITDATRPVAAYINGRWIECAFEGESDGVTTVRVTEAGGESLYQVGQVLPLDAALQLGLYVDAPHNPRQTVGFRTARKPVGVA
jgi:hypothetical protein